MRGAGRVNEYCEPKKNNEKVRVLPQILQKRNVLNMPLLYLLIS